MKVLLLLLLTFVAFTFSDDSSIVKCNHRESVRAQQHYDAIHSLYDAAIYPNSFQILTGQKQFPDVFDPSALTRIEELAYLFPVPLIKEYFFVLTAFGIQWCTPTGPGGSTICAKAYNTKGEMMKFSNNGTIATFEWTFHFYYIFDNGTVSASPATNITQSGWVRFNCDSPAKIIAMKLNVPRLYQQSLWTGTFFNSDASVVTAVCTAHQQACVNYPQYASYNDCVATLSQIPRGNTATFGTTNSTECRRFHIALAFFNPAVHCQHLSLTSDPCHDFTTIQYYDDLYNLFIPYNQQDPQTCNLQWIRCQQRTYEIFDVDDGL